MKVNGSIPFWSTIAEVAHSVEHNLAKVGVASSSLVFRSIKSESSSFGRAVAFQASGGRFEPGLSLKWAIVNRPQEE